MISSVYLLRFIAAFLFSTLTPPLYDWTVSSEHLRFLVSNTLFMVALWNRAGHYIFALWFLLSVYLLSFFPRLISAVADWMSVALVRI